MAQSEGDIVRLHCNDCRGTKHTLVKRLKSSGADEDQGFRWSTTYDVFECRGCEEVVLRRIHWFSEDPGEEETFFPPRVSRWLPPWRYSLPADIRVLLTEVYTALQADSCSVAMMGARAIIESAMVTKVGDKGNFKNNLKAMEDAGFLSRTNTTFLDAALDAGSASIHRGHRPDAQQLNTVMDIVENLLQSLFVLEKATRHLRQATPVRPSAKKKA
jgi:hypothetical protein